jgi:hypothetical protein
MKTNHRDAQVPTRRALLQVSAGAAALACAGAVRAAAPGPARARRPTPPYRVWFQPRLYVRDIDLFPGMTVDASGWFDPRLTEPHGVTALDWVYGLNHPWATGPEYWRHACSDSGRGRPRKNGQPAFISAGMAIDEWVPPALPDNEKWMAQGLRAGRRENPDVFIAIWITDPNQTLIDLGRDGTLDLIIVQGYTHAAAESGPGLTTSWEGGLRRCDALVRGGLEDKTIFCFGHITARADARGQRLDGAWIRERAQELKRRYPKMPGIAFYQHGEEESPEFRELVGACDQASGELWPG